VNQSDRGKVSHGSFDGVAFRELPPFAGQLRDQLGQRRAGRVLGEEKCQHGTFDACIFVSGRSSPMTVPVSHPSSDRSTPASARSDQGRGAGNPPPVPRSGTTSKPAERPAPLAAALGISLGQ
jgi:hypothetical protein